MVPPPPGPRRARVRLPPLRIGTPRTPTSALNTCITNGTVGTPTVVNLTNTVGQVNSLQVGANNTLNVGNNSELFVNGTQIINNGAINVSAAANNAILVLNSSTTLSGAGALTLSTSGAGGAFIQQGVGGVTLTNQSTIQGAGVIGNGGLALGNSGLVDANTSGQTLFLNGSGGVTNTGTLQASGGGILDLQSGTTNTGANITASGAGSTVNFQTAITGGTLNSSSGGTLQTITNGVATLNSVTISSGSTYTTGNNTDLFISGTLTNNGNLNVSSAANNSILGLNSSTTLTGGGTVTLSQSGAGSAIIQQQVGGLTLENVDNTIQGAGTIGNGGLALQNDAAGKIIANATGQTLALNGAAGVTNSGLLKATNGGTLLIQNTVANAGANITADNGTVTLQSAVINGGTLNSVNGGVLQTIPNGIATLNGVTLSTGSTYTTGNNTDLFLSGTITNKGAINMTSGANNTILGLNTDTTLTGGGTLTLAQSGGGAAIVQQQVSGLTLTNHDNLIQGAGIIGNGGLALVNESAGVINANVSGQTLLLDGSGGVTNKGLLQATNNGTLEFLATTVNNFGANISSSGGGVVVVSSSTIQGGTLNGTLQTITNGTATLDGTAQGALTLSSGSTYTSGNNTDLFINGTITNKGAINITAGVNNTIFGLTNNATLNGGGTVNLSQGTGNAFLQEQSSGLTLTNVNNTIQGAGIIGNGGLAVLNQAGGVIDANLSGQTLLMDGSGGTTNLGLLEATNNGTLEFLATTVNNAGGNISGLGGTVVLSSSTIQGGTLNGTLQTSVNGIATLDGTTNGAITLSSGATYTTGNDTQLTAFGTINNNGHINIAAAANNTYLLLSNNLTLNGTGAMTLSQSGAGSAFLEQAFGGLTLTNNSTIQGAGTIGNGGLAVINNGTIAANAGGGQTLLMNGSGGLDNHLGTLSATNNSTLLVASSVPLTATTFSAGTLNGHYLVDGTSGLSTLQVNPLGTTGGEVKTLGDGSTSTSVTLSGTNANTKFLDGGGNNALALNTVSTNASLTLQNGYALTSGAGGLTNSGTVFIDGTSSLSTGGSAYQQNAGLTTVNGTLTSNGVNVTGGTLQGTGSVTSGVSTIASGGTLLPGVPGTGGTIGFSGNLGVAGTLDEVITGSGTTLNSLGLTNVGGNLNLSAGSSIDFMTGSGFAPTIGTTFTIMTAATPVAGTFTNLLNNTFDGGLEKWNVLYNDGGNNVVLQAAAVAEINASWTTASGNWTTNSGSPSFTTNWTCSPPIAGGCVPNNGGIGGFAVTLNSAGNTMTLNSTDVPSSIQINSLNNQAGKLDVANASLTVLGNITNSDTIQVDAGGSIHAQGNLTNFSAGTLSGGTYTLNGGGTLKIDGLGSTGGEIATIASGTSVTLNGAGSAILDQVGNDALTGLSNNQGNLRIQGGRSLTVAGNLSNSGLVSIAGSSNLTVGAGATGNYSNTGTTAVGGTLAANNINDSGTTNVAGGHVTAGGTYTESGTLTIFSGGNLSATTFTENGGTTLIQAGSKLTAGTVNDNAGTITVDGTLDPASIDVFASATLDGSGTIIGNVDNAGNVFLGDQPTPGTLAETGNYTQESAGTLMEAISTTANGELTVTGNVNLAGALDISLLGSPTLTSGELFTLITFTGTESGTFGSIIGADLGQWTVLYNPTDVLLEFTPSTSPVPEPSLVLLNIALALGLVLGYRFTRKKQKAL